MFLSFLLDPNWEKKVPLDYFSDEYPVITIIVLLSLLFLFVFWGAYLFRIFWNYLIVDLFAIRHITYQESMAILLIIGVISTWFFGLA
jgi:hypothetical protein